MPLQNKKKRYNKRQRERQKDRQKIKEDVKKDKENYVIVNGKRQYRCQGITAKGKRCTRAAYNFSYIDTVSVPVPIFGRNKIDIQKKEIPIKCCRLCTQHSAMAAANIIGKFAEWYQYKDWSWKDWQEYQCANNPGYIDEACQKMRMYLTPK